METQLVATTFTPTVIEADCIPQMRTMSPKSVDFILTDPPYLCRYSDRDGRTIVNDDKNDWLVPAFAEMYRVLKSDSFCISFYGWHRVDLFMRAWRSAGFHVAEHLVFIKGYDSSKRYARRRHESAYVLTKGYPRLRDFPPADVMNWQYTGNRLHPTQKPVTVMQALIDVFSTPGELVLDPFCGSGSTLVAAKRLGRRSIGIEIDPTFAAVATERVAEE